MLKWVGKFNELILKLADNIQWIKAVYGRFVGMDDDGGGGGWLLQVLLHAVHDVNDDPTYTWKGFIQQYQNRFISLINKQSIN